MAAIQKPISKTAENQTAQNVFAVVAGLFFFVATLKFGNPIIVDANVIPPENAWAVVFESWQVKWGYWLMVPLVLAGLAAVRWGKFRFQWPLLLPLLWLGWQFVAATQSVSPRLSHVTLQYFSAGVILFYLGYFAMGAGRHPWPLWAALALALCWMMRVGLEQHFGGLEATRRYLQLYIAPGNTGLPPGTLKDPDFLKRIASPRIFSTFSSPDAFAGAIELLLPLTLVFLWQLTPKLSVATRTVLVIIFGGCGLVCLYWSGSKAGWLVTLIMALMALWHSGLPVKWKRLLVVGVLILGAAGFAVKYAAFFKKDRNSVGSRFTYWEAAVQIAERHPILGTGPGTFGVLYEQIKRADDEPTRLCHNDYLEQACDSGIPGAVVYSGMIISFLTWIYRCRVKGNGGFSVYFAIWLGLIAVALHSLVDYHLYMPGLAWPVLFLLGFMMNFKD